jgi:hypothetical protein
MKTWLFTLPFLGAVGIAHGADEMPAPAAQPEAAMAKEAVAPAKPAKPSRHTRTRSMPRGDLRNCLELKDNRDIIRCAESGRRK